MDGRIFSVDQSSVEWTGRDYRPLSETLSEKQKEHLRSLACPVSLHVVKDKCKSAPFQPIPFRPMTRKQRRAKVRRDARPQPSFADAVRDTVVRVRRDLGRMLFKLSRAIWAVAARLLGKR